MFIDQVFASPCLQYDQVSFYITSRVVNVILLMQKKLVQPGGYSNWLFYKVKIDEKVPNEKIG